MNWTVAILAFFTAATKFLFAPSIAISKFNFWETVIIVSGGGIAGVTVFFFGARLLLDFIIKRKKAKEERLIKQGIHIDKKVFTPFRRRIIRIKRTFGVVGIAFVTPCIISIPIGGVVAGRFYHHKPQVVFVMYASVIFWAIVLTYFNDSIKTFFGW